jgi:hypothetical protein
MEAGTVEGTGTELIPARLTAGEIAEACQREVMRLEELAREKRSRAQMLWAEAEDLENQVVRLRLAFDAIHSTAPTNGN